MPQSFPTTSGGRAQAPGARRYQLAGVPLALGAALLSLHCGRQQPAALPAGFDPSASEEAAIEIARRAMQAMGGPAAWSRSRYLAFDFVVEVGAAPPVAYRHYWDVETGRYRVEGMDEERRPYLVLFNVNTRKGLAWLEGRPARGREREDLLREAYERYINDTYWLLMPLKLLDPGAHVHYEGEVREAERVRDRIRLTFDAGIGLTSGDTYWAEVDRKSGRMERWEFVLEGDEARYGYRWKEWRRFGPLTLSIVKEAEDGNERILFLNVIAGEEVDPLPFTLPGGAGDSGPA